MDYEAKLLTKLKTRKPDYEWSIEDVEIRGKQTRVLVASYKDKETGFALPKNPHYKSITKLINTIIGTANGELLDDLEAVAHEIKERGLDGEAQTNA